MESIVKGLLSEVNGLKTYEQLIGWNKRVKDLMETLGGLCRDLDLEIREKNRQLEKILKEFEQKSFLQQIFANRRDEIELMSEIQICKAKKIAMERWVSDLQRAMASTLFQNPEPQIS